MAAGAEEIERLVKHAMGDDITRRKMEDVMLQVADTGGGTNDIISALRSSGVVEDILNRLKVVEHSNEQNVSANAQQSGKDRELVDYSKLEVDERKKYILLKLCGGNAFLENLDKEDDCAIYIMQICAFAQRFHSKDIDARGTDPPFDDHFLIELPSTDPAALLAISQPITLTLVRVSRYGERQLLSTLTFEWRRLLQQKSQRVQLKFNAIGSAHVTIGLIAISCEIVPSLSSQIGSEVIEQQFQNEQNRHDEARRLFYLYTKQWWKDYLQISPEAHSNRMVKVFAKDENLNEDFVCSFVKPFRAGRAIQSSRHAVRFVSLIRLESNAGVGNSEDSGCWLRPSSIYAANHADCESHCTLLCSLLLGYGQDAYVCLGTRVGGHAQAWVAVLVLGAADSIVFWDAVTSQRYVHKPGDAYRQQVPPFDTIGCMFNHRHFYANIQPSDRLSDVSFALSNESQWKAMDAGVVEATTALVASEYRFPPILASNFDPAAAANVLEQKLRLLVTDFRSNTGLSTSWDDNLSYILSSTLSNYELEKLTGQSFGGDELQAAIRNHVAQGHSFKGFPCVFTHRNASKIFQTCIRSSIGEQILSCRGDQVKLAIRVIVMAYAENSAATWIMIACRYKAVL